MLGHSCMFVRLRLVAVLTWLDHALLWSLKNESRFYCKLYWNDFKTKQTTRACSIYSLLLAHLKEHKGSCSLMPSKTNAQDILLKSPSLFTCEAKPWWGCVRKWVNRLAFSIYTGHLEWLHYVLAWLHECSFRKLSLGFRHFHCPQRGDFCSGLSRSLELNASCLLSAFS